MKSTPLLKSAVGLLSVLRGKKTPAATFAATQAKPSTTGLHGKGPTKAPRPRIVPVAKPASAPIVTPDSGAMNFSAIGTAADRMLQILPDKAITDSPEKRIANGALRTELQKIVTLSNSLTLGLKRGEEPDLETRVNTSDGIRDAFAMASKRAGALAKLETTRKGKDFYKDLAGFFNECKRQQVTSGAPDAVQLHATRELKKLEKLAHGFEKVRPGALAVIQHAISAGHNIGIAAATGTANKTDVKVVDDDLAGLWFDMLGANFSVNFGIDKIGVAGVTIGFQGSKRFYAGENMGEMMKAILSDDANSFISKALNKSASPESRKLREAVDTLKHLFDFLTGRSMLPSSGPLHLNDDKKTKGATTSNLHTLAKHLDEAGISKGKDGATHAWRNLAQTFYPSLPKTALNNYLASDAPPAASALDRATPTQLAESVRTAARRQPFIQFQAAVGETDTSHKVPTSTGGFFSTSYNPFTVHARSQKAVHELLDTALTQDPAEVLRALDGYDKRLAKHPHTPQLQLYADVQSALGDPVAGKVKSDFYGDVPPNFRASVTAPSAAKVKTIGEACDDIAFLAHRLAVSAEDFVAKPNELMSDSASKDVTDKASKAFREIDKTIWLAKYDDKGKRLSGGYPGGEQAALKNPEKFLGKSHDALSAALAALETHLFINKRELATAALVRGGKGTAMPKDAIDLADKQYMKARAAMDEPHLSIRKGQTTTYSSAQSRLEVNRQQGTVLGTVSYGGVENSLARADAEVFKETVVIPNKEMTATFSVQLETILTTKQVWDTRLGIENKLTLAFETGVPFSADVINKAVLWALEKKGIKGDEADLYMKDIQQAASQIEGTQLGRTGGIAVDIMLRQGKQTEKMSIAYMHLFKRSSGGVSVSTPAGAEHPVSGSVFEFGHGSEIEILGPDVSMLSMRHPQLTAAIDATREARKKAGGKDDLAKDLETLFLGSKEYGIEPDHFQRNRYFGRAGTVTGILDMYLDYKNDEVNNRLPKGVENGEARYPNEIYRYFMAPEFKRSRDVAGAAAHYAPGSTAKGVDITQPANNLHHLIEPKVRNADGTVSYDKEDAAWKQFKAEVEACKTPEERARYFTQNPTGKAMFGAFMSVVANVNATTFGALFHAQSDRGIRKAGFATRVKADKLDPGKAPKTKGPVLPPLPPVPKVAPALAPFNFEFADPKDDTRQSVLVGDDTAFDNLPDWFQEALNPKPKPNPNP